MTAEQLLANPDLAKILKHHVLWLRGLQEIPLELVVDTAQMVCGHCVLGKGGFPPIQCRFCDTT